MGRWDRRTRKIETQGGEHQLEPLCPAGTVMESCKNYEGQKKRDKEKKRIMKGKSRRYMLRMAR